MLRIWAFPLLQISRLESLIETTGFAQKFFINQNVSNVKIFQKQWWESIFWFFQNKKKEREWQKVHLIIICFFLINIFMELEPKRTLWIKFNQILTINLKKVTVIDLKSKIIVSKKGNFCKQILVFEVLKHCMCKKGNLSVKWRAAMLYYFTPKEFWLWLLDWQVTAAKLENTSLNKSPQIILTTKSEQVIFV